ncbi:GNAT family N-acetyltransferase [Octadecabacter sp. 1_MG-2023]|uniref:GNAT family N-acetyltransferase n=1 Tax=unclassified Octadecabacter TaxID=196158 RepID=UPI001C081E04|nr:MULTISPECIES: GNAT family N-acetyltransferase [unclassified Octadecabacter]MBU2994149.1 GNAT family N-acetyltransferase [Octadecabacter sp. B2R22]MDO6734562.1 GNAT family N-acetyltransferase [Octadecabacter sp. 1_MG-2023]
MGLNVQISAGFSDDERPEISAMYWAAFGQKLGHVMGPKKRALAFIEDLLDPSHAICARDQGGALLGVVGFKTAKGALVDGTWADMTRHYGWIGSTWRTALLVLLERDTENQRFLMDGVFVASHAQGKGVGTALLDAISNEAVRRGYKELRLDVVDKNPRARALYERKGFIAGDVHHLGPLRHIFGFSSATTMVRQLSA